MRKTLAALSILLISWSGPVGPSWNITKLRGRNKAITHFTGITRGRTETVGRGVEFDLDNLRGTATKYEFRDGGSTSEDQNPEQYAYEPKDRDGTCFIFKQGMQTVGYLVVDDEHGVLTFVTMFRGNKIITTWDKIR